MTSEVDNDGESASNSPGDGVDQDMADNEVQQDHMNASEEVGKVMETKKINLKDPSRPRRKKARRACFACQRAHLTCGKSPTCGMNLLDRDANTKSQEMKDRVKDV